ncbi:histidine kinase dimerization/phosphoacceptor domain-containing protein, partial [Streptomyces antimycoticus]
MSSTGEEATGTRGVPVGPWWWSRRRSMGLDVLLAVASAVECAVEGVSFAHDARIPVVVGVLIGVVVGATLVVRRRWAIAVVLISIAITPAEMGLLLGVVSLYTLASSEVPRRITALLAGMAAVGSFLVTVIGVRRDNPQSGLGTSVWEAPMFAMVLTLGLTAPPVLLGLYVRARRRLVESLRERADGLERELSLLAERAEERAEWARNEERTRIAREMHDVVAHRVSLMVVHAAALQAVALKDPEKASKNAALVGDMGRQALTELRQMLGVLRSEDGLRAPGAASAAA